VAVENNRKGQARRVSLILLTSNSPIAYDLAVFSQGPQAKHLFMTLFVAVAHFST